MPPCPMPPMAPCAYAPEPLCPAPMRPCPICPCTQAPKLPDHQTSGSQSGKLSTSNPSYNPLSFASHAFHSRTRACIRNPGRPHPSRPVPAAEIAVSGNYFRSRTLAWPLFPSKFSQVGRRPSKVAFLCKSALRGQVLWRKYAEGVIGRCWARGRLCRLTEIIVENLDLKCRFGNNLRALTSGMLAGEECRAGADVGHADGRRASGECWRGGARRKPGAR